MIAKHAKLNQTESDQEESFPDANNSDAFSIELHSLEKIGKPQDRSEEIHSALGELFLAGSERNNFLLHSSLHLTERKIAPYGTALFTQEDRLLKLKSFLYLRDHDKTPIEPGCSILLILFSDQLTHTFFEFLRNNKTLNEKIETKHNDGKTTTSTRKYFAWKYFGNLTSKIGTLMQYAMGWSWCNPICVASELSALPNEMQKAMIKFMHELEPTADLANFSSSSSGKLFYEGAQLLLDVVCQGMDSLFKPIQSEPNNHDHYKRLAIRTSLFQKMIKNFYNLFTQAKIVLKKDDNKALCEKDLAKYAKISEDISEALNEVSRNEKPKISLLLNLYQKIKGVIATDTASILHLKLTTESSKLIQLGKFSGTENQNLLFIQHLMLEFQQVLTSIVDDSQRALFRDLIGRSNITTDQLDTCLIQLANVTRSFKEASVTEINQLIDKIAKKTLEPVNAKIFKELNELCNKGIHLLQTQHAEALLKLLEERIRRCRSNKESTWERTLALCNAHSIYSGQMPKIHTQIQKSLVRLNSSINNPEFGMQKMDEDVQQLYDEISALSDTYFEAIKASVIGIENLIGKCFDHLELQTLQQQEREKAQIMQRNAEADRERQELLQSLEPAPVAEIKKTKKKKNTKARAIEEVEIISTPEVAKTEPPVLEKPQIEEVKCPVLPSVRDCLTHILTDITELQKPIEGNIDYDFRLHWRNAQLQNLVGYVLRLRASKAKKFNASAIFDQTDIAHRMIESSLEIALSHYPVISDEQSILREIADNGHQLHLSAQKLLRSNACTENLRAFVWNFRSVIYDISSANSCGNYLYSTAAKMPSLPHQAKKIAQFLLMVDRESLILTPNDTMRSALLAKHNQRLNNSLYFVEQLLEIIINPQSAIPTTLPSTVEIDALLNDELKSLQNIHFKQNAPVMRLDSTNNSENDSSLPEVATLQCALRALRNARTLITIRIFCQVQGLFDAQHRTDERNCALKNLDLYLRRLIEKLSTDRTREPYATLCSEWSLIRRAHKELTIAALLNGAFFADGAHVVDTQQLRYSNNPNHLMKVLKSNVREPAKLPHLGTWLAKAHPVLSYQAPLQQVEFQDNEANLMRDKLNKLRQITQDKSKIKGGYTLMRDGVNITVADLTTEAEQHLINDEKEKLFPAIIALHQTLKFGMPLQQSHLGTQ